LPTAPKPFPNTILRIYTLGPTQTLYVDVGDYSLFHPLVLSGNGDAGDDQGFVFTGPTNPVHAAAFHFANPLTIAPLIALNDASFVTLQNLTLRDAQTGVWLHGGSSHFTGSNLHVVGNAREGIRVEADSDVTALQGIAAINNGRDGIYLGGSVGSLATSTVHDNNGRGIYVGGSVGRLSGSLVFNNNDIGIQLENPGAAVVEANEVYANQGDGIRVAGPDAGADVAIVGNTDLTLGRGNKVHDNTGAGIVGSGSVLVTGNTVYNQAGSENGQAGIFLFGGEARANVVYDD
jgi:Right handed beta helix region